MERADDAPKNADESIRLRLASLELALEPDIAVLSFLLGSASSPNS